MKDIGIIGSVVTAILLLGDMATSTLFQAAALKLIALIVVILAAIGAFFFLKAKDSTALGIFAAVVIVFLGIVIIGAL